MPVITKITGIKPTSHLTKRSAELKPTTAEKSCPQSCGNVVPFKHYLPIQDIYGYSSKNKELAYGWTELIPVLNVLSKVFHIKDNDTVSMFVWVKEPAKFYTRDPVPKNSLIYKHVRSTDHEKQITLQVCEKILVDAYLQAKEYISNGQEVQPGFEISGDKSCIMKVKGAFGIEVNYLYVDSLLESIDAGDVETVKNWKKFFKASFVHEMVHKLREEIYTEPDTAQEIAPHAISILSTGGDNPMDDIYIEEETRTPGNNNRYQKDVAAALKILQQKLSLLPACLYKPKSFELKEINKALMSIPENIKKRILKKMSQEIVSTSGMDLLRIAAGVDTTSATTKIKIKTYTK